VTGDKVGTLAKMAKAGANRLRRPSEKIGDEIAPRSFDASPQARNRILEELRKAEARAAQSGSRARAVVGGLSGSISFQPAAAYFEPSSIGQEPSPAFGRGEPHRWQGLDAFRG
jgi:hypothetical protein